MSTRNAPEIVLGVTGSIAAYKAAELVRLMVKAGWGVTVVMTKGATTITVARSATEICPGTQSSGCANMSTLTERRESVWKVSGATKRIAPRVMTTETSQPDLTINRANSAAL